jgi:hypothetical protein
MNTDIKGSLVMAGGIIALALAVSFARGQGWIDPDTTTLIVLCAIGLMLAWIGNRMPKTIMPGVRAAQVNRVGGWSMAISGLIYAALWIFAPIDVAVIGGCAAVVAGMAVTFAYCWAGRERAQA